MNICLIANPNSAHTRRFVQGLLKRGHSVTLIGEHPPGEHGAQTIQTAAFQYIDLTRFTNFRKLRYLVWGIVIPTFLNQLQPDLLHALGASGAAWLGDSANFHPFVITATGSDLLQLNLKSNAHRRKTIRALQHADYIFCLSNQLKSAAINLGIPPERTEATYWGIDPGVFHPAPDKIAMRRQAGLAEGPVVISLRAMNAIYNPLDIARVIPGVLQEAPRTQFLVLTYNSDWRILNEFKTAIEKSGAGQAVKYIPALPDDQALADLLCASDIAISVAASDGTPVSVLESMACGNALVLGDIPTLHDWVTHEISGLFVPLGDVPALSQAILRLIRDVDLRQRLSIQAATDAREKAVQEHSFEQADHLYRRLTSP
jgi:L-malate glycosyltransferase